MVEEIVDEPTVALHQVETYLYDAMFNIKSDLAVNHEALREFYKIIAMTPERMRQHVKELSMNKKSHKDLYAPGSTGVQTIKGKDGDELEPLPEIVTSLSMVDDVVEREGDLPSDGSTYYIWSRYLAVDSGLGQDDEKVIKKMIGTLSTLFQMLNRAYDSEESATATRIEIRDLDRFLTKVANLYLKHVSKLEITFDSIRTEFSALQEIAADGGVPGLDSNVINNLSAFILSLITFNADGAANIADENDPVLSINIPFIEHEGDAAELNLEVNTSPVTGKATSEIASELINQDLYIVLESFDVDGHKPNMVMLRLNDGDFCAIAINGGWVVISTIPV